MKRFIILAVVALGMSTSSFADSDVNSKDWAINVNMSSLGQYLKLSSNQYDEVESISEYFSDKLSRASYAKDEKQAQKLREAVYGNFKLMKKTLSDEQYKKYVYLVNVTLRNKGLDSCLEK